MECPPEAVQKQVASRVRHPTTLAKGRREMAKSVEEHACGEVSCQELADLCGPKMGGHGLRPTQVSGDDDLLCRLQYHSPSATLL